MADAMIEDVPLPVGAVGRSSVGWWGLVCFLATEGALFASLLFTYCYLGIVGDGGWMPRPLPSFRYALPLTVIVVLSSLAMAWAVGGVRRGRRGQLLGALALATLLGVAFVGVELLEWQRQAFTLQSSSYASAYFVITGVHLAHVAAGVLALLAILLWAALGYFDEARNTPVLIGAGYWHFVNAVWIVFFIALYAAPYLG